MADIDGGCAWLRKGGACADLLLLMARPMACRRLSWHHRKSQGGIQAVRLRAGKSARVKNMNPFSCGR